MALIRWAIRTGPSPASGPPWWDHLPGSPKLLQTRKGPDFSFWTSQEPLLWLFECPGEWSGSTPGNRSDHLLCGQLLLPWGGGLGCFLPLLPQSFLFGPPWERSFLVHLTAAYIGLWNFCSGDAKNNEVIETLLIILSLFLFLSCLPCLITD